MADERRVDRVKYAMDSIMVVCDTQESVFVKTNDISPLGMGIKMKADGPNVLGKEVIILTSTLIMHAEVVRQVEDGDGYFLGIRAKEFSPEAMAYLVERISQE